MTGFNTKVTPEIENLTQMCVDHSSMDVSLYGKYDVKRGLRDINGKGVLAGLTQISNVQAVKVIDGKEVPCAGSLYYRGYNIKDLTAGLSMIIGLDLKRRPTCFCLVNFQVQKNLQISRLCWQPSVHYQEILCVMLS